MISFVARLLPRQLAGNGFFSKASMSMPVKMPSLSPTMTSGTIVRWAKEAGEQVDPGDVICEIQTDKAVVAMEFDEEGVMAKILVPEGTADVDVGVQIAVVAEPGENWEEVASTAASAAKDVVKPEPAKPPASPPVSPPSSKGAVAPSPAVPPGRGADQHFDPHLNVKAGPSVRLLLHLYEIDAGRIESTGYRGTMLKSDVMNYITQQGLKPKEQSAPPPAPPAKISASSPAASKVSKSIPKQPVGKPSTDGEYTDYPLSPEAVEAGKRILASKLSVPHAFCTVEVNATRLMQLIESLTDKQLKLRLGDFVVKACSLSLQVVPDMNVLYDSSRDSLKHTNSVVLTETVVRSHARPAFSYPLLTSVDREVAYVSKERKEINDRLLQGNDLNSVGSIVSVYDLSETGVRECSSVVDSSQTGVVAIGAPHPFVDPENSDVVSQIMSITLCFDNRAVDESVAAGYMDAVKSMLEDPELFIAGAVPGALEAEVGGSRDGDLDLDEVPVDEHKSFRTLASLL